MSKKLMRIALWVLFINVVLIGVAAAQTISLNVQDEPTGSATARIFNIILLITVLSIAPSIFGDDDLVYPDYRGFFDYAQRFGNQLDSAEYGFCCRWLSS